MTPSPEAGELTPERLAELTRVAEAATKGPWQANFRFGRKTTVAGRQRYPICDTGTAPHAQANERREEANAAHIATFDPPTALALIRTLQATQARLECFEARAEWEGAEHDKFKSEELRQRLRAELAEKRASRRKAEAEKLSEAATMLQTLRAYHSRNPTQDAAYALTRASDLLDRALSSQGDAK